MALQTRNLLELRVGGRYKFILVKESAYTTARQKTYAREVLKFARRLMPQDWVIRAYPDDADDVYRQLISKPWQPEIRDRIESEPGALLLIINTDFPDFDLQANDWFIIWLSALGNPRKSVPYLLDVLDRTVRRGDLFAFLQSKLSGHDPAFPPGSLSTRGNVGSPPQERHPGRHGVLDYISEDEIGQLKTANAINLSQHGGKTALAKVVCTELQRRGVRMEVKNIRDSLRREGVFERLSNQEI